MPEQSSIKAILEAKCPKCREGDMFEFPLSHLRKFSRMHTYCPVCDLRCYAMFRYSRVLFLYLFGGIKYDTRDRTII